MQRSNEELYTFYHEQCDESQRLASQAGHIEFLTSLHFFERYCHPEAGCWMLVQAPVYTPFR